MAQSVRQTAAYTALDLTVLVTMSTELATTAVCLDTPETTVMTVSYSFLSVVFFWELDGCSQG